MKKETILFSIASNLVVAIKVILALTLHLRVDDINGENNASEPNLINEAVIQGKLHQIPPSSNF
ncbi:MAG: hypothetical protein KGY68_08465 [Candidatus Thermoplasmatota archaeon]|nr:hypothetical protein [Candidatus Thermoplasmatota archaeon]